MRVSSGTGRRDKLVSGNSHYLMDNFVRKGNPCIAPPLFEGPPSKLFNDGGDAGC